MDFEILYEFHILFDKYYFIYNEKFLLIRLVATEHVGDLLWLHFLLLFFAAVASEQTDVRFAARGCQHPEIIEEPWCHKHRKNENSSAGELHTMQECKYSTPRIIWSTRDRNIWFKLSELQIIRIKFDIKYWKIQNRDRENSSNYIEIQIILVQINHGLL